MPADGAAVVDEAAGAEIGVVFRKIAHHAQAKGRHIARAGNLFGIGKARRVGECRARHAQVTGGAGHAPGEVLLRAGDMLGDGGRDIIGGLHHERPDGGLGRDRLANLHAKLRGRHARRPRRHADGRVEPQPAGIEFLEQDIERHDLGERCGMPRRIGLRGEQYLAVAGINRDGSKFLIGIRRCAEQSHGSRKGDQQDPA